jgi:hypothetical protein
LKVDTKKMVIDTKWWKLELKVEKVERWPYINGNSWQLNVTIDTKRWKTWSSTLKIEDVYSKSSKSTINVENWQLEIARLI